VLQLKLTKAQLLGEFVGTAFLLMAVVGSGIMAERLSKDVGVQLLMNAFATAGALVALILTFAEVSGARFNPLVTIVDAVLHRTSIGNVFSEVVTQCAGAIVGVMAANIMFELPIINVSTRDRSTWAITIAEVIATIGLLLVIFLTARRGNSALVAVAVSGYVAGAYFFTSSTSFANPAVTIARTLSNTFAGIRPWSAVGYIAAQAVGTAVTIGLLRVFRQDLATQPK
jgi:glycerol uptake facilitator-like aquaporin